MKEQLKSAILPALPIVGFLKLSTRDGRTLCSIEVINKAGQEQLDSFFEDCFQKINDFLTGKTTKINIPLDEFLLTPFQKKVLIQMKKIPYGTVTTYRDIAQRLNTKGFRAVGTACGKNPFLLIYPCHRVLSVNNPGGFAHGLEMKKMLLKLEEKNL